MSQRVNLRVPEPRKAEWDAHVESSDIYDNRSQFIQYAVDQQIKRDDGAEVDSTPQGGHTGASTERVDKLMEEVERINSNVESLEDTVRDATRSMRAGGSVSEETTTEVWSALPTAPERATTADGIAEGLDASSDTVRVALDTLVESTPSVEKREVEQVEEGDGVTTITDHTGRTIEIEDPGTTIKRRNALFWRRE